MARYERSYDGEKRSGFVGIKVTPRERTTLQEAAARAGTSLSQYTRELCLRRTSPASPVVAGTRRSPDAKALENQSHRDRQQPQSAHANSPISTRPTPQLDELKATTELLKTALSHVIGGQVIGG